MAGVFGEPLPPGAYDRYLRMAIAKETGWTLDYIDGQLGLLDLWDYVAVMRGLADIRSLQQMGG